jgi:hypothetical protein
MRCHPDPSNYLKPLLFCGRPQVCLRARPDFHALRMEVLFGVLRAGPRTGAQTVLNLLCAGEQE